MRRKSGRSATSSWFKRWSGIATVTSVGLGLMLAASPTAGAGGTYDFQIWNLTGDTLVVEKYESDLKWLSGAYPKPGATAAPGGSFSFSINKDLAPLPPGIVRPLNLTPRFVGQQVARTGAFRADMNWSNATTIACSADKGQCSPLIGPGKNVLALWDAPGTVVRVGNDQPQRQSDLFTNLCNNPYAGTLQISCNYSNGISNAYLPWRLPEKGFTISANYNEPGGDMSHKSFSFSTTWSRKTTLTLTAEVSAKFFKFLNAALRASNQTETMETETIAQTETLDISPQHAGYICMAKSMIHYSGTITIKTPNTTWVLTDVAVDSPDPNGQDHLLTATIGLDKKVPDYPDPCQDIFDKKYADKGMVVTKVF